MNGAQFRVLQLRTRAQRGAGAIPRFLQGYRFGRRLPDMEEPPRAGHAAAAAENPLERFFAARTAGAGICKWSHYFDIYHRHFAKFVGTEVRVLEIGVDSGGSLEMWRQYFGERCTVYGVDIKPSCRTLERDGVRIFIGDQADPEFWRRFRSEVPPLDIVIDDGGHETEQQVVSLESLLRHVRPGGVYLCEDLTGFGNLFHAYMAGLAENLHERTPSSPGVIRPNALQRAVDSIHVYPYVTVIERAGVARGELVSDHRGTDWLAPLKQRAWSVTP